MGDVRVLVVGVGNMGASHAKAYHKLSGFEIAGLMSRSIRSRTDLPEELAAYPRFAGFRRGDRGDQARCRVDQHLAQHPCRLRDPRHGRRLPRVHGEADRDQLRGRGPVVDKAKEKKRKLILGYILRHHPSWAKFVEVGRTLGKPLVMRMNLNQQSSGPAWNWHKNLMESLTPLVDCGVHYVDIMCQMTRAKPVRVHGIGAKLSDETRLQNYGALQVAFDDGSVGWYEAGWGPMMSEVAYFVKDVVGPKGCVSIVVPKQEGQTEAKADAISDSADIDQHTKTNALKVHYADIDAQNHFTRKDEWINMADEPDHQELCDREQAFFLKAIREDLDLTDWMDDAVNSLRIVLAADESIRTRRAVEL